MVTAAMSGELTHPCRMPAESQGCDVVGVTTEPCSDCWAGPSRDVCPVAASSTTWGMHAAYARSSNAPHYVMSFQNEFRAHVIDYFVNEYRRGDALPYLLSLQRQDQVRLPDAMGERARRGVSGNRALCPDKPAWTKRKGRFANCPFRVPTMCIALVPLFVVGLVVDEWRAGGVRYGQHYGAGLPRG